MKEKWYQKLKRKWNELSVEDRKMIFGGLIGSLTTGVISGLVIHHRDNRWIDAGCTYADDQSKHAYCKGIQDGQLKAYRDLLTQPDHVFKKMGMEVKKF